MFLFSVRQDSGPQEARSQNPRVLPEDLHLLSEISGRKASFVLRSCARSSRRETQEIQVSLFRLRDYAGRLRLFL